tara:strand:- start:74 stop:1108 length:1035 start_codon:yes stop_codon:yes gene_type:complete
MEPEISIDDRKIGKNYQPMVIAEIGINHDGDFEKAKKMVFDANQQGAECVKFQCHIIEDEMIENDVIPSNASESIWNIMKRCALTLEQDIELKKITEELGMIYLNTPFSRSAARRLKSMNISAYKIGSGECNNAPLIEEIASYGKPVILSTGMNTLEDIEQSVSILENAEITYALLHVTSMYPTPYNNVRLGCLQQIKEKFPNAVIGLSDHSIGNYTCFAAVPLGASILEKHFTSDKNWTGPDVPLSIDPKELGDLIRGSKAIFQAMGGTKTILKEENETAKFAYASVVSIKDIKEGDDLTLENIWVKRPGTGEILAPNFNKLINKKSTQMIPKNTQLEWNMIE